MFPQQMLPKEVSMQAMAPNNPFKPPFNAPQSVLLTLYKPLSLFFSILALYFIISIYIGILYQYVKKILANVFDLYYLLPLLFITFLLSLSLSFSFL